MKTNNPFISTISMVPNLEKNRSLTRRSFLQLSGLGLGGLLLWSCNEPPPNPSPISWQPHALTPVFYGFKDYSTTEGVPGKCRVFFPTIDGSPQNATILPARYSYPLIILAHGHCDEMNHYTKWFQLPAQLARCGYVVVVPEMPGISIHPSNPDHPSLTRLAQIVTWMRSGWPHSNLLFSSAAHTGIIGHSYGALLGARFAVQQQLAAYASIAGVWEDWPSGSLPIAGFTKPTLFIRGTDDWFTNVSNLLWSSLALQKHMTVFKDGRHWDYLPAGMSTCENGRGPCTRTPVITADIVSMFFAKYLQPKFTSALSLRIPDSLVPPLPLQLTYEQEFYAGSHLTGFPISSNSGCTVTLSWETYNGSGSV
ncbi:alpha/beta hydrolase family protein [Adhaeribacter radiodurans]|uniref:AB hydrolase-1 domain-containing protein n=1 Tax=Adhaeribacter radiodurans TaxID=2745197 RepID=A0A7L7L687_9BACT|nr:alpha/beta fold hydrolase [Adhaeribacter radiodurans]QMU28342.1 hypothetical protein HUW48_09990 [Adhaeribacter radiodurans]